MTRFPPDFADLLTPRGRALAEGRDEARGALSCSPFFSAADLIDPAAARELPALLERVFGDVLVEMAQRVPDARSSKVSFEDSLPKVARVLSTPHVERDEDNPAFPRAAESGLLEMVRSAAFTRLVAALCGHAVQGPRVTQVLCYRPGDYTGPHTDNHPEYEELRGGYTDVHLTFCTPGVKQQLLVYEKHGHLSEVADVTGPGTLTAYRLPFWHYTTPLVAEPQGRRWLLLGTYVHPGLP